MMAFTSINEPDFWGRDEYKLEGELREVPGLTRTNFVLGKPGDNAPVVRGLRMAPGFVLLRHAHECHRFEIVVQGSMQSEDRLLKVGDVMISEPNVLYGANIAGPEGCTTMEIFSTFDGAHTLLVEGPDGIEKFDAWSREDAERLKQRPRLIKTA
jgi:hypothetical protein